MNADINLKRRSTYNNRKPYLLQNIYTEDFISFCGISYPHIGLLQRLCYDYDLLI
jgi:hypothetical protein